MCKQILLTVLVFLFSWPAQADVSASQILRFSWWGGTERHEATQKAIRIFEARNPGVRIRAEYSGWQGYEDRLTLLMRSGQEPDIMQVRWAWIFDVSQDGRGFYDLNQQAKQIRFDAFANESYKTGLVWGKLNALPISSATRVFLWQRQVFDRAGLPIPHTWEQLLAAGKVFRSKLGEDYYPLDGSLIDLIMVAHAYIHQKTGKPFIFANQRRVALNHAEMVEWLHFFKRLINEHVVMPPSKRAQMAGAGQPLQQRQEWINGKWAGTLTWDSTLRLRVSTLPKSAIPDVGPYLMLPNARNSGVISRPGMLLAVSRHTRNPALAARFVNFLLTDPEAVKVLGMDRGMPQVKIATDTVFWGDAILPFERKAYEQIRKVRIDTASPLLDNEKIVALLHDTFDAYEQGLLSDDAAAQKLITDANRIISESP